MEDAILISNTNQNNHIECKCIGYIFQQNYWTEHWTANRDSKKRRWHTGRGVGGLVVGLHGEEVAEPGLLAKGEPDEVAPDLVAHLVVIVNNSRFVESSCSPR